MSELLRVWWATFDASTTQERDKLVQGLLDSSGPGSAKNISQFVYHHPASIRQRNQNEALTTRLSIADRTIDTLRAQLKHYRTGRFL